MRKVTTAILALFLLFPALPLSLLGNGSQSREDKQTTASTEIQSRSSTEVGDRPWAHQLSDIPADEKACFGHLKNGMRYVIYPNAEPPGRFSVRLHVEAGSLMEDEDQRGIAHFLEHMMFNGTRNYDADELIPTMQRLGIAFGAHANAYTSFDETVYMLDLPDLREDTVELVFNVMRDFADGALLSTEEINKERGVIMAEKVSRDDVNYRLMKQQFQQLLPDSKISHRFPIGLEEIIMNAPRERFVDFYERYYTPERMTFVVVGDIDTDQMEQRIIETFASMTNPEQPGEDPDLGTIEAPDRLQTAIFQEKEVSESAVLLLLARSHTSKPDTKANRLERRRLQLANAMLNRRLERISKEKDSPIASGNSFKTTWFQAVDFGYIGATADDDRWEDVVPRLENEFRRVIEHGFNPAELEEAKSNLINAARQAVEHKPSRKSEALASQLAGSLNENEVFSTPETNLAIIEAQLDQIDTRSCHEAFTSFWKSEGHHLVLTTKSAQDGARETLLKLYQEASKIAVEAPSAQTVAEFGYTEFGELGRISSQETHEDLGITQWQLDNGVRVNLKPTDFEKGRILILARIGNGKLTQPRDKPMFDQFTQALYEGGGLGKHSVDALKRILAGRNVGTTLSIGEDAFLLSGSTTPEDFELQCQLMCAGLIEPGFREEALWQFHKTVPMLMQQLKHTPAGAVGEMQGWLYGGDSRFTLATEEELKSYTIEEAREWLMPELSNGYLEISIVGDFDPAEIQVSLLETFGALDRRMASPPAMEEARDIGFPEGPADKTWTYDSKIPFAIAMNIWQTTPMRGNTQSYRRFSVLGDILSERLRSEVRERLGASYSPNAGANGSDALDSPGYLITQSIGQGKDLELLHESMISIADKLASEGATQDELERALKPLSVMLEKSRRENGYWLNTVMARSQENPERLELARNREKDYASITIEEINALAANYLSKNKVLSITIQSEKVN